MLNSLAHRVTRFLHFTPKNRGQQGSGGGKGPEKSLTGIGAEGDGETPIPLGEGTCQASPQIVYIASLKSHFPSPLFSSEYRRSTIRSAELENQTKRVVALITQLVS